MRYAIVSSVMTPSGAKAKSQPCPQDGEQQARGAFKTAAFFHAPAYSKSWGPMITLYEIDGTNRKVLATRQG